GFIAFSPLAQGILTDKYLNGIPEHSRAADPTGFLRREQVTDQLIEKVKKLNEIATQREQTMAEMALAWVLRDERVTSAIIGARNVNQIKDNLKALDNLSFTQEELEHIDSILN
ncbi:MAG: aldo/keto reductase, partial [Dysgonamonadaceae bacterium]